MTAKHPMIPFPVIVRAADGDIEAVNQIVRHYSGFIASRSMRPMKDATNAFTNTDVQKTVFGWRCGNTCDGTDLPAKYLPGSCRGQF